MHNKRAVRRHHRERLNRRCRRVLRYFEHSGWSAETIRFYINKRRDNMQCCSCHMCGNPRRKWDEVTMQEKRNLEKFACDLIEVDM
jgi:hypothetical protein